MNADGVQDSSGMASFMKDLTNSIPGIDEAMSFAELMKQVQNMDYSVIVFDTAPTGHTLRLLSFPTALDKAFEKILSLKNQFSGMFSQVSALLGGALPSQEMLLGKLEQTREVIQKVNAQFKDPERTTFVCVCIPEFLSLYETERLVQVCVCVIMHTYFSTEHSLTTLSFAMCVQELTKYDIDVHNVVVNQVLYPEEDSTCKNCNARQKMQQKYIDQIYDLYEDFHVVEMPLLNEEVRGVNSLRAFSAHLLTPYEPNQ